MIPRGYIFKNAGSIFDWSLQRKLGDGFLQDWAVKSMRARGAAHVL